MIHDKAEYNEYDLNGRRIATPDRKPKEEEGDEDEDDEDGKLRLDSKVTLCALQHLSLNDIYMN